MSKLLSNLSEILIICDSLITHQVIKSIAVGSRSQFLHVLENNKFHLFSSGALRCCLLCCCLKCTTISGADLQCKGLVKIRGQSSAWQQSAPSGAAAGEVSFVPTSEFSVENNENPRVCPEMVKSFAAVEMWADIKKKRGGGCWEWGGEEVVGNWYLDRVHWKAPDVVGYSENSHYQILFNTSSASLICNSSLYSSKNVQQSKPAPSAAQNSCVSAISRIAACWHLFFFCCGGFSGFLEKTT